MKSIEDEARKTGVLEIVPEDEEHDFQEEFYPQSIMNAGETVITVDPEPDKKEPEKQARAIVNSQDLLTPEGRELAARSRERTEKEMIQIRLLNRAKIERDPLEASKVVRRLDKGYLIKFLSAMGDDDDMPQGDENKPVYLEAAERLINSDDWPGIVDRYIAADKKKYGTPDTTGPGREPVETPSTREPENDVKKHPQMGTFERITNQTALVNAMRTYFNGTVINGTLPVPDLLKLAERLLMEKEAAAHAEQDPDEQDMPDPVNEIDGKQTTGPALEQPANTAQAEPDPYAWDDGGPLVEAQLKIIANLKAQHKITDPVTWGGMVGQYKDAVGNPLPLAAKMTAKQAEHLIQYLDDTPPF